MKYDNTIIMITVWSLSPAPQQKPATVTLIPIAYQQHYLSTRIIFINWIISFIIHVQYNLLFSCFIIHQIILIIFFLPSGTIRIRGICCARHFDDGGTRREHVCIILYVDLFNFRIDKKSVMTLSVQQKQKTQKKTKQRMIFLSSLFSASQVF